MNGKYTYTRRNYHNKERSFDIRWIVHEEGKLRGSCECYDEPSAMVITNALNNQPRIILHDDDKPLTREDLGIINAHDYGIKKGDEK